MPIKVRQSNNWVDVSNPAATFPSGTLMLFQQTTAPTGWTKQTAHNDKALRVVSGSASSGGTTAFTSVFTSRTPVGTVANHTLTVAQMPSHNHPLSGGEYYWVGMPQTGNDFSFSGNTYELTTAFAVASQGGGEAHSHGFTGSTMDFAVQYVDLIIASKN